MMRSRIPHDDRGRTGTFELIGSDRAVLPIGLEPATDWDAELDTDRGDHPPDDSEPGMALGDIVHRGSPRDVIARTRLERIPSRFVSMPPVQGLLLVEERELRGREEAPDPLQLVLIEISGGDGTEEPLCQMGP